MKGRQSYLIDLIPVGRFTAKSSGLNGGQLAALREMEKIRKVGSTGPMGRYAIWEAI